MPTANPTTSSCCKSAGRTHPSQRAAGLESEGGNQRSFSIGWPIRFESRTCNPQDPCFVGRSGTANLPKPEQRPAGTESLPSGLRMRRGSIAHRIYLLLSRQGATKTKDIATELDILLPQVWQACKRFVEGRAIKVTRVVGHRHELFYSIGDMPVVEV